VSASAPQLEPASFVSRLFLFTDELNSVYGIQTDVTVWLISTLMLRFADVRWVGRSQEFSRITIGAAKCRHTVVGEG